MARARNIKPGFFSNDVLGELPPLARLLFAGLWTVCDRAGRVEDRPKKIKAEVLPYDDCDADELLRMLESAGFIARYQVQGVRVIQVLTWEKHQNPHIKEAPSSLPAQCKPDASTVQAPDKEAPEPERAGLIPDSGFRIPDSKDLSADTACPRAVLEAEGHKPTAAGLACRAIRQAGIQDVNPGHPNLARLLDAGVTAAELAATAGELVGKRKGSFALLLATVEGRRRDAAAAGSLPAAPDKPVNTQAEETARMLEADRKREIAPPPAEILSRLRGAVKVLS